MLTKHQASNVRHLANMAAYAMTMAKREKAALSSSAIVMHAEGMAAGFRQSAKDIARHCHWQNSMDAIQMKACNP